MSQIVFSPSFLLIGSEECQIIYGIDTDKQTETVLYLWVTSPQREDTPGGRPWGCRMSGISGLWHLIPLSCLCQFSA